MNFIVAAAVSAPGVYYAYQHSDSVGKGIVLLLLVISSITWTVMVDKGLVLRRSRLLSLCFLYKFRAHQGGIASPTLMRENPQGPIGELYSAGVDKLNEFYEQGNAGYIAVRQERCKLSEAQLSAIEAVLEREVSHQIEQLETKIGMLGTMVSLSPFLGLFGTVWGVMMAFCAGSRCGRCFADYRCRACCRHPVAGGVQYAQRFHPPSDQYDGQFYRRIYGPAQTGAAGT